LEMSLGCYFVYPDLQVYVLIEITSFSLFLISKINTSKLTNRSIYSNTPTISHRKTHLSPHSYHIDWTLVT
jgi:hypothetical protein